MAVLSTLTSVGTLAVSHAVAVAGASEPTAQSRETNSAYAIIDATGGVLTFGGAGYYGDTLALGLQKPIVGAAANPSGGYWLVASDGGIFAFGGAQFYGSTGGTHLNQPIVGMAPTPDGGGYWLVASDGGIFAFGDAPFWGSTGSLHLNQPVVGMAATPDGRGYWLVAADGGIFAFGDANFWGSTGALHLNKPIVGMAATGDGGGYWLAASDGGIFAFGDAPFYGSMGGTALNAPIVGMSATPDGRGYWLVGSDDGLFTFGDAGYSGSAESPLHPPLFPGGFSVPIPPAVAIIPDVPGPSATHSGELRVAITGDSLALYEAQYTAGTNPPYMIDDGAAAGCGVTNGATLEPWSAPGSIYTDPGACALWAQQLTWVTARFHPDVAVLQVGYWESQNRLFNGQYVTLADAGYSAFIQANLEQAVNILHADGAQVLLATSPLFNDGTPANVVQAFNQIVQTVAQENASFVHIFDAYSLLDPDGAFTAFVNGVVARTPDGVHLTQPGVTDVLDPPLNQQINAVGGPVYQGTG
ncbi:MAG TPA: hypothetical protein VG298_02605 [Acidimicrobiales bacterium]|nr:hypothetical protein [Acidimicrobiales bacterium]